MECKPDVLLLNSGVSSAMGLRLVNAFKRNSFCPAVMFVTNNNDRFTCRRTLSRFGANDLLYGPFNRSQVISKIRAVLKRKEEGHDNDPM